MSNKIDEAIHSLREAMREEGIDSTVALGTELFLFISSLTLIINIDLLVSDEKGRILLAWRDDRYCGTGWHIPGGVVRFKETLDDRVHKTAVTELRTDVDYDPKPIVVLENIANDKRTVKFNENIRGHFISLLYKATVTDEDKIQYLDNEKVVGHLKWFDHLPEDFLDLQWYYRD